MACTANRYFSPAGTYNASVNVNCMKEIYLFYSKCGKMVVFLNFQNKNDTNAIFRGLGEDDS
jgi:hypothetical protein